MRGTDVKFTNIEWMPRVVRYRIFGQESRDLSILAHDTETGRIVRSVDDAVTYVPYCGFVFPAGESIKHVHHLPSGEILVATADSVAGAGPKIYKSRGWASPATAVFEVKLTLTNHTWLSYGSFHAVGNAVMVSEYGLQTDRAHEEGMNAATKAYFSRDGGETFTLVFDLDTTVIVGDSVPWGGITKRQHLHGCGYDAIWDRLWLVIGDAAIGLESRTAILYSDDSGLTWHAHLNDPLAHWQSVGVLPLRHAVVFGSDGDANGLRAVTRAGHRDGSPVEAAHMLTSGLGIEVITNWLYQAPGAHDSPALFAFGGAYAPYPGGIIVSLDEGLTFHTAYFEETLLGENAAYHGAQVVVGPTNTGRYVSQWDDESRYSTGAIMVADLVVDQPHGQVEEIYLFAESFSAHSGAPGPNPPEKGRINQHYSRWGFTNSGTQAIVGGCTLPSDWEAVKIELLFTTTSSDSGNLRLRLRTGYDFATALISPNLEVTVATPASNSQLTVAEFPSEVFTQGLGMRLMVERLADDSADTYPQTMNLHAVRIKRSR